MRACTHTHTEGFVYRGKYVCESGVVRMDEPNIALVKFYLSSNVRGSSPDGVYSLSLSLDCLRDNSLQPGYVRPDWSTIREIHGEDLYPLIFSFSAISVSSLLVRMCVCVYVCLPVVYRLLRSTSLYTFTRYVHMYTSRIGF